MSISDWIQQAVTLPIAFAQVREDPELDAYALSLLGGHARIAMICSGGCTLAYLSRQPGVRAIAAVDPNPAQIALARLKLELLHKSLPSDRLALLGHTALSPTERDVALSGFMEAAQIDGDALGPRELVNTLGPDHAGRYERAFASLRRILTPMRGQVESLLSMRDPAAQARACAPETSLGHALDSAFAQAMALDNLIALFGKAATQNPARSFADHFAQQTRSALGRFPGAHNPYLWQVLAGRYPAGSPAPWLALQAGPAKPKITFHQSMMDTFLARATASGEQFNLIHLSNILDWLTPQEAHATLKAAFDALDPGGIVIIRQLNSTLDIPQAGGNFNWDHETGKLLCAQDRSYFYKAIHLGRKP